MMKTDFQRLFRSIGDVMVEALRPITAKLVELESRKPQKGDQGIPGVKGDPGTRGEPGAKGEPGVPGERGEKGLTGDRGEPGLKGDAGERGEQGLKGDAGERGEKGLTGDRGELGLKGDAGERGERGLQGDAGERGEKGLKGEQGVQGIPGVEGEPGERGERGLTGERGMPGVNGKDGTDGHDGKSVTMDDVLPALDGAVAKWMLEVERRIMDLAQRAIEAMPKPRDGTNGIDGKDGLNADDFQFNFDLETRTFSATHQDRVLFSQRIPYPKYMDVWAEQFGEYEKGFMVTFGGSVWIAKRDTRSKPGTDDSWQLCVKKGRDGK